MRLGETNPDLRIILLTIYTEDGTALATNAAVGYAASDLKKTVNGAAPVDAGGTLEHIEDGLYKYTATLPEASAPGILGIAFVRAGFSVAIGWAPVGPIFTVGETDVTLLRLPLTIYDVDGALATGATVSLASQLRTNLNGGAFADSAGSLVEVGYGLYYYQGVVPDAAAEGALGVKYERAGFGTAITFVPVASPGDEQGPLAAVDSPTQGTTIETDDPIVIEITDPSGVASESQVSSITFYFIDGSSVVAWDGADFGGGIDGTFSPITDGQSVELAADDGWPTTVSRIVVVAEDDEGNESTTTLGSWLLEAADEEEDDGPEPIPETDTLGTAIETIDLVAHATDRLPEYLRP